MTSSSNAAVFSLYRLHSRQIRQLPHVYLRLFFRIKVADDVRAILNTRNCDSLRRAKIRRVFQDLSKLQAANKGNSKAFAHILDLAYGRKGKLRWEIMKPLLSDNDAPLPPQIIPAEEKSRPPVYSRELAALLTSAHSRTTKLLDMASLSTPPTLPTRADSSSEEARLLGRLSKRREVNIRWRYFSAEWKKVLPPLQVTIQDRTQSYDVNYETTQIQNVVGVGIRAVGMQGSGVLEDVENIVGSPWMPSIPTRRERRAEDQSCSPVPVPRQQHPTRWLRRRYQELLGRLPILTYSHLKQEGHTGKFEVSLHPSSITPSKRYGAKRLAEADAIDLVWIQQASEEERHKSMKQK